MWRRAAARADPARPADLADDPAAGRGGRAVGGAGGRHRGGRDPRGRRTERVDRVPPGVPGRAGDGVVAGDGDAERVPSCATARPRDVPASELVPGDLVRWRLARGCRPTAASSRRTLCASRSRRSRASRCRSTSNPTRVPPEARAGRTGVDGVSRARASPPDAGRCWSLPPACEAELGRVAEMLRGADAGKTPLQQRLDVLVPQARTRGPGAIVALVFATRARPRRVARHAAADRGQPGGRGDPREPARGRHDHPGARRPADAAPQRADPSPLRGRDARVGDDDLLRQDRHADPEPDDRRRPRHGGRPAGSHRRRRRCRGGPDALRATPDAATAACGRRAVQRRLARPTTARWSAIRPRRRWSPSPTATASARPSSRRSRRGSASCRSIPSASG